MRSPLLATILAALISLGAAKLVFQETSINNQADSASCEVHQGNDLTLLDCDKSFELYDSHDLYDSPYSLINWGESRGITGVRKSLETSKTGSRTTYIQDNKALRVAYVDEEGQV